jgi:hypothetical protein
MANVLSLKFIEKFGTSKNGLRDSRGVFPQPIKPILFPSIYGPAKVVR